MPYTSTNWVAGSTALSQANMNNLETQYTEATNSFEQDLFTAFVFSGLVCTKDGTIATQLDVTAGVALIKQTDNTLRRRAPTATNFSTSGHPSTTLYLDLNPDGTWSWGTSHSGVSNYLAICSVTTDSSSNISTVVDARTTTTTLLSGISGRLTLPTLAALSVYGATSLDNGAITSDGSGDFTANGNIKGGSLWIVNGLQIYYSNVGGSLYATVFNPLNRTGGQSEGYVFQTSNGSTVTNAFSIGSGNPGISAACVDNSGNYYGGVGTGVPTTRNGVAASVPIYTGTTTPTSPPTGSIWVKA